MVTSARTLNSASSIAAHTAMCVQLEGLLLRGEVARAAAVKTRRSAFRHIVLLAAVLLAALWSAHALSNAGSLRDIVVPGASAGHSQR
jgi:hypothetical protein